MKSSIVSVTPSSAMETRLPCASAWFLFRITLVTSIAGLLFGFDTAVISGTFGFIKTQFALTDLQVGWFGSSALLGCVIGALFAGGLGDRYGRKPMLFISAAFFFITALFAACASSFEFLIIARILGGLGVGMASVIAPMFISEFAPAHRRGRLVALYQLSIVVGILAAYFSNWLLLHVSHTHSDAFAGITALHQAFVTEVWRGMFGAEMVPALAFFLLLLTVPESPRWLVQQGRNQEALMLLSRISGAEKANPELAGIQAAMEHKEGTFLELFRPGLRLALLVGVGLSVFGQMTGVNIVVYYGPDILKAAGFGLGNALQYQVGLGLINLVATLLALWKIDKWGRRPLLVGGMSVVTGTMALMALLFGLHATAGIWIVIVMFVYMACVALSICAVIWVLTPEIFPNRIRGRGASIATFANWATNCINTLLFPWYTAHLGISVYFMTSAAICLVATLFFWKFVPETKGRSLEEIEQFWSRAKKA